MRACLKLLLFAVTAGAAYLASQILVSHTMPVADSKQPQ